MSHNRKNQVTALVAINILCLFVLFFFLLSCGKQAQIVGEVLDGFGIPLKDAVVSVEGTTFKGSTDSKGKYSVGYVPGKIKVIIHKEGYTSVELSIDIATESTFPAQPVTLYMIPASKGIFLFGKSDYIPLTRGKISFKSKEFPFSWNRPLFEETYIAVGEFTSIGGGAKLRFLDNDPSPIILAKLSEAGVILSRAKFWGAAKDKFDQIKEETSEVAKGLTLRVVSLDKGKYAFVSKGISIGEFGHPIAEPAYLFEIK